MEDVLKSRGIVCGSDHRNCADLSWPHVEKQLIGFLICWLTFVIISLFISANTKTSNLESWKARSEKKLQSLRASAFYVGCNIFFSILQCLVYCIRTYTRATPTFFFMIEIVACVVALVDAIGSWVASSLQGMMRGLVFCFTQGIIESLILPSVLSLAVVEEGSPPMKTWFSFSFVASLRIFYTWRLFTETDGIDLNLIRWQFANVVISVFAMIFFATCAMQALENLGDNEALKALNHDGRWSLLASWYYIFSTISTVGYGDIVPITLLGRFFAIVVIIGGIAAFSISTQQVLQVMRRNKAGGGSYEIKYRFRHIIVCGAPSTQMLLDLIAEVYHKDHADDADDLEVVIMLPENDAAFARIRGFLKRKDNLWIYNRITIIAGSALNGNDLQRAGAFNAACVLILPNIHAHQPAQADTETIMCTLTMRRLFPNVRVIALVLSAANKSLLKPGAASRAGTKFEVIGVDEFKLSLMGKSCEVNGFSSIVCNLIKTAGEDEDAHDEKWKQDYLKGLGNELYEIPLSTSYAKKDAMFGEIVLDCLDRSENSTVYLIGLIEQRDDSGTKRILINPGPWYEVRSQVGFSTSGIFIASDRDAIRQLEEGEVIQGRRTKDEVKKKTKLKQHPKDRAGGSSAGGIHEEVVERSDLQKVQDKLELRALQFEEGQNPPEMPYEIHFSGGHILFCALGTMQQTLGLEYFIRPLRLHLWNSKGLLPIVVLAYHKPKDWYTIAPAESVYFVKGNPLSLFDLEKASFRNARVIIIAQTPGCNESNDPSMMDANSVIACKLIESELDINEEKQPYVITELALDISHQFLPLPGHLGKNDDESAPPNETAGGEPTSNGSGGFMAAFLNWAGKRSKTSPEKEEDKMVFASPTDECFLQGRFASGRLFMSSVVTSLVVNTFYNPALALLIQAMNETNIELVDCPVAWEGRPYLECFDILLFRRNLLAIGLFRKHIVKPVAKPKKSVDRRSTIMSLMGRKSERKVFAPENTPDRFVFTAPAAKDTAMITNDQFVCFNVNR